MTPASQASILGRADASRVYDLSIDYFVGMPSFQATGDPSYQIFMSHTPNGTVVDNLNAMGTEVNQRVCYSGDVIFMYTHTGTHIDALNHFGVDGKIQQLHRRRAPGQSQLDARWRRTDPADRGPRGAARHRRTQAR
jgi:hypothetical protein